MIGRQEEITLVGQEQVEAIGLPELSCFGKEIEAFNSVPLSFAGTSDFLNIFFITPTKL